MSGHRQESGQWSTTTRDLTTGCKLETQTVQRGASRGCGLYREGKLSFGSFVLGDPVINRCCGPKDSKHLRSKPRSERLTFRMKWILPISNASTQFLSKMVQGSLALGTVIACVLANRARQPVATCLPQYSLRLIPDSCWLTVS